MKGRLASPGERAPLVLRALARSYPKADCELDFKSPLELLVATILSAQCTDARVNLVTPALFKKYRTARAYASADQGELEGLVRSTGFFRNKARSIRLCCAELVAKHKGQVPEEMDALTALPGVGRKTANLVRAYAFGKPGIICDTHVLRVSARLGLASAKDPDKVEGELSALVQKRDWTLFSTVLMWHGRRVCSARRPSCEACEVFSLCPFGQKAVDT
ncbi:MAG TPA: endonuclease III [bacterium]|nr:endonuclease III [bacterium]